MFAVGHMAIAYLLGKGSSKVLRIKLNIPLLFVLSILPDVDIIYDFLTGSNMHRRPTHSIVFAIIAFAPLFIIYHKKAIPYFLALISHPLIGDFFIGGRLQLFWPFSTTQYGLHDLGSYYIGINDPVNIALELSLFAIATFVLYKSGDWKVFLKSNKTNLVLIIPIATVLLPSTIGYPFSEPLLLTEPLLAIAHLFYLVPFSIAVSKTLSYIFKKRCRHSPKTRKPKYHNSNLVTDRQ
ncbi:metal-dependent hydrolase [Candidatus Bathyarchaeota archaeon]|nr:MAG: metal-dependent hydrolase [Candidatus Bathyarchaeota archaeon]